MWKRRNWVQVSPGAIPPHEDLNQMDCLSEGGGIRHWGRALDGDGILRPFWCEPNAQLLPKCYG